MKDKLAQSIREALKDLGLPEVPFVVEHPEDLSHGDYATNVAFATMRAFAVSVESNVNEITFAMKGNTPKSPRDMAEIIKVELEKKQPNEMSFSVAGPGFINITLASTFFHESLAQILKEEEKFGRNNSLGLQKTIVEYTDPNPFKEFHIGHVMSNTIGESLSRLLSANGAEVKRACYSGDKGIHVAKAVAHKLESGAEWKTVKDVAHSYAEGAKRYDTDETFKQFVVDTNKKIYLETDAEVNDVYMFGRKLTLDYFEILYKTLGTTFDFYFFESTTGEFGKALVHTNTPKIFEESEGAIIFRGESRDAKLHTRVFINKEGLPTYEAKELGLAKIKYDVYPYDSSVVITGNEVNDYFRVLMCALGEIFPELSKKTHHIGHGMLRLPTGKMSSRTGDVITAEELIETVSQKVRDKMKLADKDLSGDEALVSEIAIGAIKYSILRQAPGRDVVFDFDTATSFEGDSGPYLQYTNARIQSLLEKGRGLGIAPKLKTDEEVSDLEKTLYRFPEVVARAYSEYAPHAVATFLIEIAGLFNAYYGNHLIIDEKNPEVSSHRMALAQATAIVIQNGLHLLGIKAPERM